MKKEVNLCDACKKTVAVRNCDVCNADLCDNDTAGYHNIIVGGRRFGTIFFCVGCKKTYSKARRKKEYDVDTPDGEGFYDEIFQKNIFDQIRDYIKNKIVAEKL